MSRRWILAALCAALVGAIPAFGLDEHEVIYLEGYPIRRGTSGSEEELAIGDGLVAGETVVTTDNETVEMEAGGYTVTVGSNTVFRIMEVERNGETQTVLSNVLGKLRFARNRATGRDPLLMTNSAVCGVRGTDFTIWSGDDGGSLIVVADGAVEVSSSGESVSLAKGEGVEVDTGAAPGEKFQALQREISHEEWSAQRLARMLQNPVAAAEGVEERLDGYIEQIRKITPLFDAKLAELNRLRAEAKTIQEKEGQEKGATFYQEKVAPVENEARFLFVNKRFYALSALSLRRFVLGRLYMQMKSRSISDPAAPEFAAFLEIHNRILAKYQDEVVDTLVPADI